MCFTRPAQKPGPHLPRAPALISEALPLPSASPHFAAGQRRHRHRPRHDLLVRRRLQELVRSANDQQRDPSSSPSRVGAPHRRRGEQASLNPSNTVYDASTIGRRFTDAAVQHDMKLWPFKVV